MLYRLLMIYTDTSRDEMVADLPTVMRALAGAGERLVYADVTNEQTDEVLARWAYYPGYGLTVV